VSYDLRYPVNHRRRVSDEEAERDKVSPKVGLTWALGSHSTLRASYTRSLGGVSLDQSFRLGRLKWRASSRHSAA
jgi:outer membrane receptor protein involved in Fe transport